MASEAPGTIYQYSSIGRAPSWVEPPPPPEGVKDIYADMRRQMMRQLYQPQIFKPSDTSEEDTMNSSYDVDCCKSAAPECASFDALQHADNRVKAARRALREAKAYRTTVRAEQTKNAEALAQYDAGRADARAALLRVINDPSKGYASVEAARTLLEQF